MPSPFLVRPYQKTGTVVLERVSCQRSLTTTLAVRDLAEAVWRVICSDGVERASVRAVAAEAGVSVGSLRHFFPSQSDLLAYAMNLVVERVDARVAAAPAAASERQAIEQRLHQLLPLDEPRRTENEVWLAFTAQALVRPELGDLWADVHDALRQACTIAVEALGASDIEFEDAPAPCGHRRTRRPCRPQPARS